MAWEQVSNAIKFYAFFTASKTGKAALSPTVYVLRNGTAIVTAGSAAEVDATNAPGLYSYELASGSVTVEGEYIAVFRTADATVDAQHIPSLWIVGRAGVENLDATVSSRNATTPPTAAANATAVRSELATELARVDAAVTTRLASASYVAPSTPPSADTIANTVWDELTADHTTVGTMGKSLSNAGSAADPLENSVPGDYPEGSAGFALGRIGVATISVSSPVAVNGFIGPLIYGDDYYAADGRSVVLTLTGQPTLVGSTTVMEVNGQTVTGSIVSATQVRLELSSVQTMAIGAGMFNYDLKATLLNTHTATVGQGTILIVGDQR